MRHVIWWILWLGGTGVCVLLLVKNAFISRLERLDTITALLVFQFFGMLVFQRAIPDSWGIPLALGLIAAVAVTRFVASRWRRHDPSRSGDRAA